MPEAEAMRSAARDRRRERRPVAMVGFIMPQSGFRHLVELFDLNYGGCGIRTPISLLPGDRVKLTVHERGSIPAEVRWCKDGRAGLDFSPSEEVHEPVNRKESRVPLKAEALVRARGRPTYRVAVHDLSTTGCQVEFVERPCEGDRLSVKFFGLEALDATVCWVERSTAGLAFANPIHPVVFELLLDRLEVENNQEVRRTARA